jgi:hypothetical protein
LPILKSGCPWCCCSTTSGSRKVNLRKSSGDMDLFKALLTESQFLSQRWIEAKSESRLFGADLDFTLPQVSALHLRISAVEGPWFIVAHVRPSNSRPFAVFSSCPFAVPIVS